jgi:hypothetical protein
MLHRAEGVHEHLLGGLVVGTMAMWSINPFGRLCTSGKCKCLLQTQS